MSEHEHSDGLESLQTWEEACIISQQWADDARRKAERRKTRNMLVWIAIMLIVALAALVLILYVLNDFNS